MCVFETGGALARFVQRKLTSLHLWENPYFTVREGLKGGVAVCEQWVTACEHLTGQVWKRYSPHPWNGEKHRPQGLKSLAQRLEEVRMLTCQSSQGIGAYFKVCLCISGVTGANRVRETSAFVIWRTTAGFSHTGVSTFYWTQPNTLQSLYRGTHTPEK